MVPAAAGAGSKVGEEEHDDGEEGAFDVSSLKERLAKRGGPGPKRSKKGAEEAAAAKKKKDVAEPKKPKQKARARAAAPCVAFACAAGVSRIPGWW